MDSKKGVPKMKYPPPPPPPPKGRMLGDKSQSTDFPDIPGSEPSPSGFIKKKPMKKMKTFLMLYLLINIIGAVPILAYFLIFGSLDKNIIAWLFIVITVLSFVVPASVLNGDD